MRQPGVSRDRSSFIGDSALMSASRLITSMKIKL